MLLKKLTPPALPALLLMTLLAGCPNPQGPVELVFRPNSIASPQANSYAKRFQNDTPNDTTVVESAMELSQQYAKLSEQAAALKKENYDLAEKNRYFKTQLAACKDHLNQTQKELAEANDLLLEMRIELNNWKNDVLGFRDEMRHAQNTQLQTLLDILKILGGDIEPDFGTQQQQNSSDSETNQNGSSLRRHTQIQGEPNE